MHGQSSLKYVIMFHIMLWEGQDLC